MKLTEPVGVIGVNATPPRAAEKVTDWFTGVELEGPLASPAALPLQSPHHNRRSSDLPILIIVSTTAEPKTGTYAIKAKELCRWLETVNLKHLVLCVLVLGVVVRLAILMLFRIHMTIAFGEMEKIARSLAENGTFADPYKLPTGPTAHHAPAYPLLLSLIFRAFGYGPAAAYARMTINVFFASLQFALLPVLTDVAKIPRVVGATAGFFGALVPYRVVSENRFETALSGLVIVVLILITTSWWRTPQPSRLHTFCIGLAWGAGMLCSSNLLLVFLLALLFFAVSAWRQQRPQWLLAVALAALGMTTAVTPWTIRNYLSLGGLIFVRSNFGIEFSISNRPSAYPLAVDNVQIGFPHNYFHEHHPWANAEAAEKVRQMGEIQYNRQCTRQAIDWIRANPSEFAKLTLERIVFFWFTPSETQSRKAILLMGWTLAAAGGLWVALRRHRELGLLLLALWIGYPLVHYLVQANTRYRDPIEWSVTLLGVYVLTIPLWSGKSAAPGEASTPADCARP